MSLPGRSTARLTRCGEVRRRRGAESLDLNRCCQAGEAELDTLPRLAITELTRSRVAEPPGDMGLALLTAAHRRFAVGAK